MEILREEEIKREFANIANNDDEGDCHLYLQYQPIMDLKSDRISGFEALARLKCSGWVWYLPWNSYLWRKKQSSLYPSDGKLCGKLAFPKTDRIHGV